MREKTERRGQTASGFSDTEENLLFRGWCDGKRERPQGWGGRRGGGRRSLSTRASRIPREGEPKENAFGVVSRTWPAFRPSSPSPPALTHSLSFSRPSAEAAALVFLRPYLSVALFRRCEIQCQRRRDRGTDDGVPKRMETVPHSARAVVYLPRLSLLRSNGQRCRLPMALPAPLQRVGEESPLSRLRSPSKIGRRYGDRKSRRRNVDAPTSLTRLRSRSTAVSAVSDPSNVNRAFLNVRSAPVQPVAAEREGERREGCISAQPSFATSLRAHRLTI